MGPAIVSGKLHQYFWMILFTLVIDGFSTRKTFTFYMLSLNRLQDYILNVISFHLRLRPALYLGNLLGYNLTKVSVLGISRYWSIYFCKAVPQRISKVGCTTGQDFNGRKLHVFYNFVKNCSSFCTEITFFYWKVSHFKKSIITSHLRTEV